MHLKTPSLSAASLAGLFLAAALPASAQTTAVDTAQTATTTQQLQKPLKTAQSGQAPLLYESELEDIGPQYVLQPHERPKYFSVTGDFQLYHTDNAALANANKVGTDVSVLTLQFAVQSEAKEWTKGIQVQARAGFRYQSYWYGVFSGRDDNSGPGPALSPVKDLDFQVYSPYVELNFKKDPWYGSLGLRYGSFNSNNAVSNENFYSEVVPSGSLGYQYNIDSQRILQFQYDGDFRATHTDEKGLHPSGYEDRVDQAVSIIFSHIIGEHIVVQPAYRLMWSKYTNYTRSRTDIYNTVSFMVAYYFNDVLSARAFTSVEWRNSTFEAGVDNSYQSWNLGLGISLNASF